MKSLLQDEKECFFCRTRRDLSDHHIFPGSFRNNSEIHGLKVWLCNNHHTGYEGVHRVNYMMIALKQIAQRKFEETHTREEFIKEFGRNYLE